MIKKAIITGLLLTIFLVSGINSATLNANGKSVVTESSFATNAEMIYRDLKVNPAVSTPSWEAFSTAIKGFNNLKNTLGKVEKNILSVVDFSLPSTEKRFWVINLDTKEVLFNDYVAHGRNSGNNVATNFSNIPSSNTSSLGFYITAEKYHGKHLIPL